MDAATREKAQLKLRQMDFEASRPACLALSLSRSRYLDLPISRSPDISISRHLHLDLSFKIFKPVPPLLLARPPFSLALQLFLLPSLPLSPPPSLSLSPSVSPLIYLCASAFSRKRNAWRGAGGVPEPVAGAAAAGAAAGPVLHQRRQPRRHVGRPRCAGRAICINSCAVNH